MKDKTVKMRTITITGPFGVDSDGDEFGALREECFVYSLHELKRNPAFTYEVEDVRRELPTEEGALIRATVTDGGVARPSVLLRLSDPGDDRPWRVLDSGPWFARPDWISGDQIGDDWVELVPRSE